MTPSEPITLNRDQDSIGDTAARPCRPPRLGGSPGPATPPSGRRPGYRGRLENPRPGGDHRGPAARGSSPDRMRAATMAGHDPFREFHAVWDVINRSRLQLPGRDWEDFRRTHEGWLARYEADPLYYLPEAAIARLECPRLGHPPLLDAAAAAAERGLLALCCRYHAVGFGAAGPIVYPYLDPSPPRSVRERFPDMPSWTEADWADVEPAESKAVVANRRLKGYAGWLVTEPPFLAAVAALKARWHRLPAGQRPAFPLRRTAPTLGDADKAGPQTVPEEVAGFAADRDAFLDRWGLIGMASWDLPEPQGPLFPSLLGVGAPALPGHALHLVLPLHYPLAHDDDLLRQILGLQRGLAADRGLDRTAAGLPHHGAYTTILEVEHWERVVTGRYGRGTRRRGFIGLVVEAVAEAIGREVDLVEKWRKAISACRRGERSRIKALRVVD
jgi:hypothetical protein